MSITVLLLTALLVVSLLTLNELRNLASELRRRLDQNKLDDIVRHKCPRLFYDVGRCDDLRRWFSSGCQPWENQFARLHHEHELEKPEEGAPIDVAASQGNRWAQIQLVADASASFEDRRNEFGLSMTEAKFLLYKLWHEQAPDLPLRDYEWSSEAIVAYILSTKAFAGIAHE